MIKTYIENNLPFIEVDNGQKLRVILCGLGASVYAIYFNNELMTLTPKNISDFKRKDIYHGKTIGAIANRVKDGLITINDVNYQMDKNKGLKCLHGGKNGLSNQLYDATIKNLTDDITIVYSFNKKDMLDGLPGNISYQIIYTIKKDNSISIEYIAKSDKDTVLALTNHSYFTLGSKNLDDLELQISADTYIEVDKVTQLPLENKEVNNVMDFNNMHRIMDNINDAFLMESAVKGYDHHYNFNDNCECPIKLENGKYRLEITTTFKGCQIYTMNYDAYAEFIGIENKLRNGIAIEPQDSLLERGIFQANKSYNKKINYKFIIK